MTASSPRSIRVTANNPSAMTLEGTNTYVLVTEADDAAIVIDPGPEIASHLEAILEAVGQRDLRGIVLTHHHADHSELLGSIGQWAPYVPVFAADERFSRHVEPLDINALDDASVLEFGPHPNDRVQLIPTPGHTLDSLSVLHGTVLYSGDTVLGRGTTVIMHGSGSVKLYLETLERLRDLVSSGRICTIEPAHGERIDNPGEVLDYYRAHRRERLDEVRAALTELGADLRGREISPEQDLVHAVGAIVYRTAPQELRPTVHTIVAAQLEYLLNEGAD